MNRLAALLVPILDYNPEQRFSENADLVERTSREFLRLFCPKFQTDMGEGSGDYPYPSRTISCLELGLFGILNPPENLIRDPIPHQIGAYIRRAAREMVEKPPRTESFNQMLIRADLALELSAQYLSQMRQTLELQRMVARVCDFDHTLGNNFPDLVGIRRP